eukprot:TRINITY_DN15854_c0_g2_i3.p1 TRINITY_DN15854_c0_g2~~TRINITY_DN15854_c0_g2_i3.p1  ORF type:complete len:127 (-),score=21.64 TRINITY_DN15854_c0_g2_i3:14-394(-)
MQPLIAPRGGAVSASSLLCITVVACTVSSSLGKLYTTYRMSGVVIRGSNTEGTQAETCVPCQTASNDEVRKRQNGRVKMLAAQLTAEKRAVKQAEIMARQTVTEAERLRMDAERMGVDLSHLPKRR